MSSSLPWETRKTIAAAHRENHLRQLLVKRRPPKRSNTPTYWAYCKAQASLLQLATTVDDQNLAAITITTNTTNARVAQSAFSRILEKRIRPHCKGYLAFYERTENWLVHLHVIAAMNFSLLENSASSGESRRLERELAAINDRVSVVRSGLSQNAKRLERQIKDALARQGLGFIAQVEIVEDIEDTFQYFCKYLKGVNDLGRLREDKGIRLFSASGCAKVKLARPRFLVEGERLRRAKLAAYAASHGAYSMAEARRIIGPRWAYYAREEARGFKLRNYPTEKDYWIDWLKLWPPEAVGVRIDDPHYRPDNRQFLYRWQFVEECFQQLVRHTLATALPLPPEAWPGGGV